MTSRLVADYVCAADCIKGEVGVEHGMQSY